MKTSFKNKWVAFHREKSKLSKNNRVLLFKPLSYFFVLLFPFFLYLNNTAGLKSISGFVLLILNIVLVVIFITDLINDAGKKIINITTCLYIALFSFLIYYVGLKLLQVI